MPPLLDVGRLALTVLVPPQHSFSVRRIGAAPGRLESARWAGIIEAIVTV